MKPNNTKQDFFFFSKLAIFVNQNLMKHFQVSMYYHTTERATENQKHESESLNINNTFNQKLICLCLFY